MARGGHGGIFSSRFVASARSKTTSINGTGHTNFLHDEQLANKKYCWVLASIKLETVVVGRRAVEVPPVRRRYNTGFPSFTYRKALARRFQPLRHELMTDEYEGDGFIGLPGRDPRKRSKNITLRLTRD